MSDYLPRTVMACRLPEDLVTDILSRLPVKTLLKFQLVSASWRSLIKNPYFIQMHTNRDHRDGNNDCFIIVRRKAWSITKAKTYSCSKDIHVCKPTWKPLWGLAHGVGCCNGIICTSIFKEDSDLFGCDFLLFNPAIRDFKFVCKDRLQHPFANSMSLGFGYDSRANDYKIVRINQYNDYQRMYTHCEVYSRNSDSWRSFEGVIDGVLVEHTSYANVCGAIHWLAKRENQWFIVSFDLSNEVLGEIMLPAERNSNESRYLHLRINAWKDCLAAIYYYLDQEQEQEQVFEIWSMIKYGVRDSWVKVTSFHKESLTFSTLSIWNDDFVLGDDNAEKLVSYNPHNQERKKIIVPGGLTDDWEVFNYKESLVIVDLSPKFEFWSKLELKGCCTWKNFGWFLVTLLVMWIVAAGHWWPPSFFMLGVGGLFLIFIMLTLTCTS